jgi:hypothetical protein
MMQRLRLSHSFFLTLLAVAGLAALAYFPLHGIRAAGTGATILASAGKPLVNLKSSQGSPSRRSPATRAVDSAARCLWSVSPLFWLRLSD